jgi:hypothetical protein
MDSSNKAAAKLNLRAVELVQDSIDDTCERPITDYVVQEFIKNNPPLEILPKS